MDGIINIYKEKGYTSPDVVAVLRQITGIKKIGHTGTLYPEAKGVLPVCIGKATKLCGYMTDKDKEYVAKVKLGIVTDTLDMTGNILKEGRYDGDEQGIINAAKMFVGNIMQTPPMYSAVKVNGKKLYELARNNIEVERKERAVYVYSLDVFDTDTKHQEFKLRAKVSKGTYIRSLCDDIGKALGCGACMSELERVRSGVFDIESSITLAQAEDIVKEGGLSALSGYIVRMGDVFALDKAIMKEEYDIRVKNGNDVSKDMFLPYEKKGSIEPFIDIKDSIAVYLSDGIFKAIYKKSGTDTYRVLKMF